MTVVGVIITFNPEKEKLISCVRSLINQVTNLIIVKNSPEDLPLELSLEEKIEVLQLDRNTGIAYAQNRGIEKAIELNATWILFSDQDTVYPENYINSMFETCSKNNLQRIGALVPVFYNEKSNKVSKIMLSKVRSFVPEKNNIYEVSHSISSGTLVPLESLKEIGYMREDFFIDSVDTEWCWRAIDKGFKIYCLSNVEIQHCLGDEVKTKFGFKFTVHSLFREYYILRNGYYLLKKTSYLSGKDRFVYFLKLRKMLFEAKLIVNFDKKSLKIIKMAVINGKNGKLIPYENKEN